MRPSLRLHSGRVGWTDGRSRSGIRTSPPRVAPHLGLHSRFQLARLLEREGLPPLHRLADWVAVLGWVWEWERSGASLFRLSLRVGKDRRACCRTVERVLGVSWSRARAYGAGWVLVRFFDECRSFRSAALSSGVRLA